MKAEVSQLRQLLDLADIDAELTRTAHRATHLPEQQQLDEVLAARQTASDQVAVLRLAVEDIDGEVSRLESEIDSVRQREDRDRALLDSSTTNAKQLTELQHELETLQRRQGSLEDSLLEVMQRREDLTTQFDEATTGADALESQVQTAQADRDNASEELERTRADGQHRRETLTAALDSALIQLYERQRASSGTGAGRLQGVRCGACRIEIDRGELSRFAAAADDEVLRCPECGAILVRGL